MERRRCTSISQQMLLVKLMETHRSLALSEIRHKEARAARAQLWTECAKKLNAEGPARTAREWAKVWNDLKCKVRVKMLNMKLHGGEGDEPNSGSVGLSPSEARVANILTKANHRARNTSRQLEQPHVKMDDDPMNNFVVYIEEGSPQDIATDLLHVDGSSRDAGHSEQSSGSTQSATPRSKERPLSSHSEESQHWESNTLSSSFMVSKNNINNDNETTTDSNSQTCSNCENIIVQSVDKRNEVFGQLVSEELNHIKPCLRSRTYARILKFLDEAKGLHSDEIKFEGQE